MIPEEKISKVTIEVEIVTDQKDWGEKGRKNSLFFQFSVGWGILPAGGSAERLRPKVPQKKKRANFHFVHTTRQRIEMRGGNRGLQEEMFPADNPLKA